MSSHTPGPWTISAQGMSVHVVTPTGNPVLFVQPSSAEGREAFAGNLSLIAAAPDMLEALRALIPFVDRLGDFIGNGEKTGPDSLGARCDARLLAARAIRKATQED